MAVYIVDVGGASLKHGLATSPTYTTTPNYMRMSAKASAVQIRRPVERGYVGDLLQDLVPPGKDHTLLLTSPLFTPEKLLATQDEVVFEEFEYSAYASVVPQAMAAHGLSRQPPVTCIVDMGFSCTYIVPVIQGHVVLSAVRRLNVGGKLLTNYLKECVSYRQWNMMDSFEIIDEVKEAVCSCSLDFTADMHAFASRDAPVVQWALPDYVHTKHGAITPDSMLHDSTQVLRLGVEQITVPEILFHPSDIGVDQAGLASGIADAILACPDYAHGLLFLNIVLTGGTSKLPRLRERLEADLRPLVPSEYALGISSTIDPIGAVWEGCQVLATDHDALSATTVTRAEYLEHGSAVCRDRFRQY
ncbi:hypothetical protein SPRG_04382 [Saprolegnia parasitica CBS 223.65]|uniref:Actin-like protein ARP6 n=1 Tax=Saprolegnia parasitica (strain CBS 223.65) TaxID=695850 RepID=A0A067CIA8_SAPPC|nr:hypothetical protein SPRG_04382 [Saprolegnia parasitica CBS 223.65]KDO30479.1 hypothetical protein SPRG_04382 [Saprolegnia parasitica CBS 223.65]|eukprot:XP_012198701.1 hypothetical protein SPRG_04382 [Saprolegnia parasitica CBS 223.65]